MIGFRNKEKIMKKCQQFLASFSNGPFTKDVRLTPGEEGLLSPDVQLLFECDSIVLSGRRGEGGSRNPGFSRTSSTDSLHPSVGQMRTLFF